MNKISTSPPAFVDECVDLAQPRLGAGIVSCSDDFFAACERMLSPEQPCFIEGKFDDNGKWMDGWESRRRRHGGYDHAIIKLGCSGVIKGVDIDTRFFTGNFPPQASLEACSSAEINDHSEWTTLVDKINLNGNQHHYIAIDSDQVWTHLRLNIFPDGGIARLRVYGVIHCDWEKRDKSASYDMIATVNGGLGLAWNDAHFGQVENLLSPGKGINMGDGWETRRRREAGNDWCVIALGHKAKIDSVLVDTAFFKGNYPDRCSIQAINFTENNLSQQQCVDSDQWPLLLDQQKLQMDAEHRFEKELKNIGAITHIRLNIFPDGGVSRLRLIGKLA